MDIEKIQKFITSAESLKRKVTTESAATFIEASLYVTKEFIAEITALQDRLCAAESRITEWFCESCNTVYPAPKGFNLLCKCGDGTLKPSSMIERELVRRLENSHIECKSISDDRDRLQSIVDEAQGQEPFDFDRITNAIHDLCLSTDAGVVPSWKDINSILCSQKLYALPPIPAKQVPDGYVHVDEVIQLCRDFSSRTGSIYIGDVEAALTGMLQSHPEPKQSVEINDQEMREAYELACMKKYESNLARCFLRLYTPDKQSVEISGGGDELIGYIHEIDLEHLKETGKGKIYRDEILDSLAVYSRPSPNKADVPEEIRKEILIDAIRSIEKSHFRTVDDHGASEHAQIVLGHLRGLAGLPMVFKSDLPAWDGEKYAMPENSNLLANCKPLPPLKDE